MDTRLNLWKQTAFGHGTTTRFSRRPAVIEERNRQATQIHKVPIPELAGASLRLEFANGATQITLNCCVERKPARTIVCFSKLRNFERHATGRFKAIIR